MLAATRPTNKASRSRAGRSGPLAAPFGRIASFALSRPGAVALALLFGGGGIAISVNALWMQTERHPLPLLRPVPAAQRHAAPAPERSAAAEPTAPRPSDAAAPGRPMELHPNDAGPRQAPGPAPKAAESRKKDPIGDLIGTAAPTPLPPARPSHHKQQGKAAAKPTDNALTALIERTTASR